MNQTALRLAIPPDAYEIGIMSRYLIETGLPGWSWTPDRVTRAITAPETNVVVARIEAHLVGFGIMEYGDTRAHLSLLAVKPSHQRCGIGTQLLEWLEHSALTAGITTITLELRVGNYGARNFYRRLGFKEAAYLPGYYRGMETALRMSRDIRRQIPDSIS